MTKDILKLLTATKLSLIMIFLLLSVLAWVFPSYHIIAYYIIVNRNRQSSESITTVKLDSPYKEWGELSLSAVLLTHTEYTIII